MASLTGPLTLQTSADEVIEWRAFLLQCEYPLLTDFVAEVAEEESGRWRRAINLACRSPVRAVAGDYPNDCQRDFGMT